MPVYWSQQRGRNQYSNGSLGVRASSVGAGRQGGKKAEAGSYVGRQAAA